MAETGQTRTDGRDACARIRAADPTRPFVVAQLGQSLDGRIATLTGESRYINHAAALDHLHRLRASVDAVVVGAGTIAADDPLLTVRRVEGHSPARVAIDPTGRLGAEGQWLARDGVARYLVSTATTAPGGAELIRPPVNDGAFAPSDIVAALFARGLRRLLIEGGARTISLFIDAGQIDRLHLLVAPVIIGSGKTGLDLAPITNLASALRPRVETHHLGDGEMLFDCDLRARSDAAP
jgi:riboflavin-specific deaminase-like protein